MKIFCRITFLQLVALLCSLNSVIAAVHMVPISIAKDSNLIHIARDFCGSRSDWRQLAEINNIKSPYRIYADTILQVPLSLLLSERLVAKVGSVSGKVFLVENGSKLHLLKKGDTVLPGQTVVTGKEAFAHLIFPDNRYARIASESKFSLTYLVRLADKSMKAEFFLEQGKIVHAVKQKLRKNETYITRTPVSITGVRGTEFRLKMVDRETNYVETLSGTVGVDASGQKISLEKGEGLQITEGAPLQEPRKLPKSPRQPDLADVYRTLPITFFAPENRALASYRLRVCKDRLGKETILEQQVEPGGKFILLALEDRTYYGFLTSIDSEQFESIPTGPFLLTIRTVPSAPIMSNLLNGKSTFEKKVTHNWLKGDGVKQFHLQLARDPEFKEIVEDVVEQAPEYITPELDPGKYFFRVQAIAEDGFHSLYSLVDSWDITEQPSLGKLDVSSGDGVSLRWAAMGEGITYSLQVARDKKFKDLIVDAKGVEEPTYVFTKYLNPANYYVRIRGVLGDGQVSPWTPYQILKIEPESFGLVDAGILAVVILLILL